MPSADKTILRLYVSPTTRRSACRRLSKLLVEFSDIYEVIIIEVPDNELTPNLDGVAATPALVIDRGIDREVREGPLTNEHAVRRFLLGCDAQAFEYHDKGELER